MGIIVVNNTSVVGEKGLERRKNTDEQKWPYACFKEGKQRLFWGAFVWEYSGIRMYPGIYSGYSAPEQNSQNGIQEFRNENSSQTNAYLHYSNYSYSGLIPNERALNDACFEHGARYK